MCIANVTNDCDNITSSNYRDYDNVTSSNDNMTLTNCTNNENNIVISIPTLLLTIPCGGSFLCFMSLLVYTLIKIFFNNKWWQRNFYTQLNLSDAK